MWITHFGHACVLAELGTRRFLFDPGEWSSGFEGARELDGILITHKHLDHLDAGALQELVRENPGAMVIVDPQSAEVLPDLGVTVTVAQPGQVYDVAGVAVAAVGGQHAVVHPDIPVLRNIGYVLADGAFYHPGDSYFVPGQSIDVLGLPTGGPWLKVSEVVDFLRIVAPRVAVPIHELSQRRPEVHYRMFTELARKCTHVHIPEREKRTEL